MKNKNIVDLESVHIDLEQSNAMLEIISDYINHFDNLRLRLKGTPGINDLLAFELIETLPKLQAVTRTTMNEYKRSTDELNKVLDSVGTAEKTNASKV